MTQPDDLGAAMVASLEGWQRPRRSAASVTDRRAEGPQACRIPLQSLRDRYPEHSETEIVAALQAMNLDGLRVRVDGETVILEPVK